MLNTILQHCGVPNVCCSSPLLFCHYRCLVLLEHAVQNVLPALVQVCSMLKMLFKTWHQQWYMFTSHKVRSMASDEKKRLLVLRMSYQFSINHLTSEFHQLGKNITSKKLSNPHLSKYLSVLDLLDTWYWPS